MHHSASSTKSPYKLSGNFPKQWKEREEEAATAVQNVIWIFIDAGWSRPFILIIVICLHFPSLNILILISMDFVCFFLLVKKIMHRLWWMKFLLSIFLRFWEFKMRAFAILENDFQPLLVKIHRWKKKIYTENF